MIHMRIPNLPISVDHAYESITRGRGPKKVTVRRLSDAGRKYKNEVRTHIIMSYPDVLPFFKENHPYVLVVQFTFHGRGKLYNKSWLAEDPKKRAKSRYKRLDVSNRLKLFEDALSEAVGLDDKHNFFVGVGKTWHRDYEATDVWVFNRDIEEDNPIDAILKQLRAASRPESH